MPFLVRTFLFLDRRSLPERLFDRLDEVGEVTRAGGLGAGQDRALALEQPGLGERVLGEQYHFRFQI